MSYPYFYPHIPIHKAWTYRLLFVCVCVCLFVRLQISPPRIKLAASNFARRFIGVQGREFHILGNFAPPEAQNRTNRPARRPRPPACKHETLPSRCAKVNVTLEMRRSWNRAAFGRRIGMCGYTSVPEDGRTCSICNFVNFGEQHANCDNWNAD